MSFLLISINFSCAQKQRSKSPTEQQPKLADNQQSGLPIGHKSLFVEKFNSKFINIELFIACITLNEMSQYNKNRLLTENEKFLDIANKIQSSEVSYKNVDSLIEGYVNRNNHIDFLNNSTMFNLKAFMKSYQLSELIFSEIDSDDKEEEMDTLKAKIMRIDDLKKIYLLYMEGRPDLSSLSSGEGIALNLHLAYYLYIQNEVKTRTVVKNLL